jgi:hypothetical protein
MSCEIFYCAPPREREDGRAKAQQIAARIWDTGSWRRKGLLKDDTGVVDTISLGGERGGEGLGRRGRGCLKAQRNRMGESDMGFLGFRII